MTGAARFRSRRLRGTLVACLGLGLTLLHDRVVGFSWYQYGGSNVVWAGATSVRYLSPSTFPPNSTPDIHYRSAMGLWNLVPACPFTYAYVRNAQDYPIDHFDGYSDSIAVPASSLDPGVLGVTYLVNSGAQWFDMDMEFSDLPENVGWTFDPNPTCDVLNNPTPSNGFSFLLVAAHELGHAIGLGHDPIGNEGPGAPWFVGTMNPSYPAGGAMGQENIIELHTDDRNGARFLYPHSGPSGPPLVDLASPGFTTSNVLGFVVPLFFSPAAALPGQEIVMRSVIENLGTTNTFFIRQGFYISSDEWIDTSDTLLGSLTWDLAFQDALQYDVATDLPADIAAGTHYLGAILDDLDDLAEEYEDNNAAVYCEPITINRLAPVVNNLGQHIIPCGQSYTSPPPTVTHPVNMAPITWSIDNPQPDMTIHPTTGRITWPSPVRSAFLYTIYVRAINSSGSDTEILFLGVDSSLPQIAPIADHVAGCGVPYTGPTPAITQPSCMSPIINWSLDAGPPGMTINFSTGVVSWPNPQPWAVPYTVTVRATNSVGNGTESWLLRAAGGDMTGNGVVQPNDWPTFGACITGPSGGTSYGCTCADIDVDNDVDLRDAAALQAAM